MSDEPQDVMTIEIVQSDLISLAVIAKSRGQHWWSDYLLATSSLLGQLAEKVEAESEGTR